MNNSKVGTWEYFCEELIRFRELMSSKKIMMGDPNLILNAWEGLIYVSIKTNENIDNVTSALSATQIELNMRMGLIFKTQLEELLSKYEENIKK